MSPEDRAVARMEAATARAMNAMRGEPALVRAVAGLAVWFDAMDDMPPEQRRDGIEAAISDMREMLSEAFGERSQ